MLKTSTMLLDELRAYRYPANKLARLVQEQAIVPVVRGLYETDRNTPGQFLAASIYGPSYLSFEYALSYWQLIPEAVYAFTSATYGKKKKKQFKTAFGLFTYRDVPTRAYPVGIQIVRDNGNSFLIADPAKALCDQLYTISPMSSLKDLEALLYQDLRIASDDFANLSRHDLAEYAKRYKTANHKLLLKLVGRRL